MSGRPVACRTWQDTVVDLVVGAAPPARARAFHRHRARCGACQSEYASALSLATALADGGRARTAVPPTAAPPTEPPG